MDDGVVAGSGKEAIAREIAILKELGLFLNYSKCKVSLKGNLNSFSQCMKWSNTASIGDIIFCAIFVTN